MHKIESNSIQFNVVNTKANSRKIWRRRQRTIIESEVNHLNKVFELKLIETLYNTTTKNNTNNK